MIRSFRVVKSNRFAIFTFLALLFIVLYMASNKYPHTSTRTLPLTVWEKAIPFMPWTAWIYITDYIFPFCVAFRLRSSLQLTRLCVAFFLMIFAVTGCFFFFPTIYPRELFPVDWSGGWVLYIVRLIDSPVNCFPSAHVSLVWVSLMAVRRERSKDFLFFHIWAILITLSTLTTKQHYLADVTAGAIVGYLCFWISERLILD